jgi:glycine amidinotransferase
MNVLVISEDKVIVEAQEESMAHVLEDNGFTVLPIDFRKVFEFGGSLHCSTWDIEREDSQVDMFPNFKIEDSEWHQNIFNSRNKQ